MKRFFFMKRSVYEIFFYKKFFYERFFYATFFKVCISNIRSVILQIEIRKKKT